MPYSQADLNASRIFLRTFGVDLQQMASTETPGT